MNIIKQLFCKHEWVFDRNIYGDEINHVGGRRSWWYCPKCGASKARDHLYLDLELEREKERESGQAKAE